MNVGEFFISLGVKGSEKTVGALSNVKNGLGDLKSMSLEAKAGLLAAVYAFEQLMAASSKTGTQLTNFNALTGISAQTLQRYQYAARQVGISNDEMQGSFQSVQNVMTNMRLGKAQPEGLSMLSGKVGFDASRALKDTEYVMKKLQEYANAEKEVGMRNTVLKSFGLGDNVIAGMSRNAFRPDVMAKAPKYNDNEIKQLDKVNAAWSNLSNKVQMAIGHFNAVHGGQLVNDLSKIADKIIKLVYAFQKLAETIKLFEGIGKIFEGWTKIFDGIASGVDAVTGAMNSPKKADELKQNTLGFVKGIPGALGAMGDDLASHLLPQKASESKTAGDVGGFFSKLPNIFKPALAGPHPAPIVKMAPVANPITPGHVAPTIHQGNQSNSTQNNNVSQTFHFETDGSDHKQVGDAAGKAVKNAYYQTPQFGGL